jgi:hypothetical protein
MCTVENTQALTLSWQPDIADQYHGAITSLQLRWHRRWWMLAAVVVAASLVVVGLTSDDMVAVGLGVGVAVVWVLGSVVYPRWVVWRHWRQMPSAGEPVTMSVSREEIVMSGSTATSRVELGTVSSAAETDQAFLLELGGLHRNAFVVVPKRAFPDGAAMQALRDLLAPVAPVRRR